MQNTFVKMHFKYLKEIVINKYNYISKERYVNKYKYK